tara:strand:+ start:538 stop:1209 length:672 start_codon:yes stop_codon:yes gene_type:complete
MRNLAPRKKKTKSLITGTYSHWWCDDVKKAECTGCKEVLDYSKYLKSTGSAKWKEGYRPVLAMCKSCDRTRQFDLRRKNLMRSKYRDYKYQMRREGNDYDLNLEEFAEYWPKDNLCPVLGYELKLYPAEERGKWTGGRHYPYTPTIDHIDPRQPLSKDNFWIISWRANEIKSDTIPCEVALLNHALIRLKGGVINNFFLQKEAALQQLDSAEWLGKYSSDRKL